MRVNHLVFNYNLEKKTVKCNCFKSQCLKKYCECYANGLFCTDCDCTNCYNNPRYSKITEKKSFIEADSVSCNCTKSNCMKKYCECYKSGQGCKESCRCINCLNNKVVDKPLQNLAPDYIIESTSIYVHNEDIIIHRSKYNPKEPESTPRLVKKRGRGGIEDTTEVTPVNGNAPKVKKMNVDGIIKNLDKIY
jgi:hypothetical protein